MKYREPNPPSKISFTAWGETATIELEGSDLDMEKFYDICVRLAGAAGFHPTSIKDYFGDK